MSTTIAPPLADDRAASTRPRQIVGVLRLAAAALVLSAVITQIVDQLVNDAFEPEHYFSYFTIESSLINIVVLTVGGVLALRWRRDPELFSAVRLATVAYAIITAAVYNILLRGLPPEGFQGVQWPNEVEHVWIPIVIVLDWLLSPGRPSIGWKRLWLVVSYPVAWCAFTLVRGAIDGWYPYPFIDPTGDGGYPSVFAYIIALSIVIVVIGAGAIGVSRFGSRKLRA